MTLPQAVLARLNAQRITRPGVPPLRWCRDRRGYFTESGERHWLSVEDILSNEWEVVA